MREYELWSEKKIDGVIDASLQEKVNVINACINRKVKVIVILMQ